MIFFLLRVNFFFFLITVARYFFSIFKNVPLFLLSDSMKFIAKEKKLSIDWCIVGYTYLHFCKNLEMLLSQMFINIVTKVGSVNCTLVRFLRLECGEKEVGETLRCYIQNQHRIQPSLFSLLIKKQKKMNQIYYCKIWFGLVYIYIDINLVNYFK